MQMASTTWFCNSIKVPTTDHFKTTPFAWGGVASSVVWTGGTDARNQALAAMEPMFAGVAWDGDEAWPANATNAYKAFLKKYFSIGALRLLVVTHQEEPVVVDDGERATIVDWYGQHPYTWHS